MQVTAFTSKHLAREERKKMQLKDERICNNSKYFDFHVPAMAVMERKTFFFL
jgi:hypothetical protein